MTPEFGTDLVALAPYGVPLLLLVFWLTQICREALALEGRYVPLVSVAAGLAVAGLALVVPEPVGRVVLTGLGLAAAANLTVRYTRQG